MYKNQPFLLTLLLGLVLLISSCACTTEFLTKEDLQLTNFDEYRLKCYVQENSQTGQFDLLNIEFDFCTFESYPQKCIGKKLIDSTVIINPTFAGEKYALKFQSEYASTYSFIADNWRNSDEISLNIQYQIDSAGIILNRKFNHTLIKEKNCRTRFALH